jgi:tartrate dehydratase beta subunit/fumarate hydratase class I family protein
MTPPTPKVRIYRARDLADAQLVADLLRHDGLPVEVRGQSLAGLAGAIPIADAMPTLWVSPHNVGRARGLIAQVHAAAAVGTAWVCACGEENEAAFGSCWSCGRDRPDLWAQLHDG